MLYVHFHVQCPHKKIWTDPVAVFVYLVKNYYTFAGWYIKTNIEKKFIWQSSDLLEPRNS